jgi:hypothetical protein
MDSHVPLSDAELEHQLRKLTELETEVLMQTLIDLQRNAPELFRQLSDYIERRKNRNGTTPPAAKR